LKLRLKKSFDLTFKGFGKNRTGNHGIISNYNVGISDISNTINTKSIQNSPITKNEKKREIDHPITKLNNNKANDNNIKSSLIIQTINNFSYQPLSQSLENDKRTQTIIINTKDRFKNRIIDFNKEEEEEDIYSSKITSRNNFYNNTTRPSPTHTKNSIFTKTKDLPNKGLHTKFVLMDRTQHRRNNFNNNTTRPSPTQTKYSIFTKTKDFPNKGLHTKFVLMDRSQHLNMKKNLIKFENAREAFQERLIIKNNNKNGLRHLLNTGGINASSFSIYFYYFRNVT